MVKRIGSKKQGAALRGIRVRLVMTPTEFAARLRMSAGYLVAMEAGIQPITGSVLASISERFRIPLDDLVQEIGFKLKAHRRRNGVHAA